MCDERRNVPNRLLSVAHHAFPGPSRSPRPGLGTKAIHTCNQQHRPRQRPGENLRTGPLATLPNPRRLGRIERIGSEWIDSGN